MPHRMLFATIRAQRLVLACLIAATFGCAIRTYDATTGVEHLWGVGHVATRIHDRDLSIGAVARRSDAIGLIVSSDAQERTIALGWLRLDRLEIQDDAAVVLEGQSRDLLELDVCWPPVAGVNRP
jgi:hypothetical protein